MKCITAHQSIIRCGACIGVQMETHLGPGALWHIGTYERGDGRCSAALWHKYTVLKTMLSNCERGRGEEAGYYYMYNRVKVYFMV